MQALANHADIPERELFRFIIESLDDRSPAPLPGKTPKTQFSQFSLIFLLENFVFRGAVGFVCPEKGIEFTCYTQLQILMHWIKKWFFVSLIVPPIVNPMPWRKGISPQWEYDILGLGAQPTIPSFTIAPPPLGVYFSGLLNQISMSSLCSKIAKTFFLNFWSIFKNIIFKFIALTSYWSA